MVVVIELENVPYMPLYGKMCPFLATFLSYFVICSLKVVGKVGIEKCPIKCTVSALY